MKKVLGLLLAMAMLMTLVGSALAETNKLGWEVPAETLKVTIFIASDNWTELEEQKQGIASMKDYLLKNFNIELGYQTTDGDAEEAVNLMLASGEYPDVIKGLTTAARQKFVDQGRAVELTSYLENSPNLKARLGEYLPMYADKDGKFFYLPTSFGNLMDLPDYSAHLRYDEWLAIGSPKIETPDDYYNAIMAILDKFPTTPAGETRYSLSLYKQGYPEYYLGGYFGLQQGWKVNADNTLTYWAFTDEGKRMAQFINKFWRSGTMDPDSFTNAWDDLRTKISQERVVGMMAGWWIGYNAGHEIWSLTDPTWTENKRYIQVGFKDPAVEKATVTCKNNLGSSWTIITDKCKNPEAVMKFIDFMQTDAGSALCNWGIPGPVKSYKDSAADISIWDITSPTEWKFDETSKQKLLSETWDYNDEGVFGANTGLMSWVAYQGRWADGESCIWPNQMWYSENKWKQIMFENMKDTIVDATALLAMGSKSEELTMAEAAVKDAWTQSFPLVCMAEDDDTFEAAWVALQDSLTAANVELMTKEWQANYQANLALMGK
jgi:putative aldouronate transport system substrate-binding protein